MKTVPLNAQFRTQVRHGEVKKLRATGQIPAVIYGRNRKPETLEVSARDLENLIHHSVSENLLVDLAVKGDGQTNRLALVQEVQHHPLTGKILHVDLHEVSADEKVTLTVPLETVGEPVGVKTGGGVLEHVLFKLKVRALPKDLPEFISVDVSHLELNQTIHIGEIQIPPGVEILGEKHIPVISVAEPRAEEEAAATTEATATASEVEMIKEKKEDGAEGAPAKGAAAPKAEGKGDDKKAEKPAAEKKK